MMKLKIATAIGAVLGAGIYFNTASSDKIDNAECIFDSDLGTASIFFKDTPFDKSIHMLDPRMHRDNNSFSGMPTPPFSTELVENWEKFTVHLNGTDNYPDQPICELQNKDRGRKFIQGVRTYLPK